LRNAWRYCHFGNFPADDARDAVSRVRSGIFAETLREATIVPAVTIVLFTAAMERCSRISILHFFLFSLFLVILFPPPLSLYHPFFLKFLSIDMNLLKRCEKMINFFDTLGKDSRNVSMFTICNKLTALVIVTGRKRLPMSDLGFEFSYGRSSGRKGIIMFAKQTKS